MSAGTRPPARRILFEEKQASAPACIARLNTVIPALCAGRKALERGH